MLVHVDLLEEWFQDVGSGDAQSPPAVVPARQCVYPRSQDSAGQSCPTKDGAARGPRILARAPGFIPAVLARAAQGACPRGESRNRSGREPLKQALQELPWNAWPPVGHANQPHKAPLRSSLATCTVFETFVERQRWINSTHPRRGARDQRQARAQTEGIPEPIGNAAQLASDLGQLGQ